MKRYEAWFLQAESDLRSARALATFKMHSHVCFMCQQAAEKALKSLAFFKGADLVKSHSLVQILKDLNINGALLEAGKKLELYYISARYPDALPDNGLPAEVFGESHSVEALANAELFLVSVKQELKI